MAEDKSDKQEKRLQEALEYSDAIIATVREPLLVLDKELRIITANRSFYRTFQVNPKETEKQLIYDLGNHQWDIPRLRDLLEDILPMNNAFENFEVEHDFESVGRKTMLLNARKIYREMNQVEMILLAIEDITKRKKAEEKMKRLILEIAKKNNELEEIIHVTSHDLSSPLISVIGFSICRTRGNAYTNYFRYFNVHRIRQIKRVKYGSPAYRSFKSIAHRICCP
jgi:PAS domain S-box-containing protein